VPVTAEAVIVVFIDLKTRRAICVPRTLKFTESAARAISARTLLTGARITAVLNKRRRRAQVLNLCLQVLHRGVNIAGACGCRFQAGGLVNREISSA
jgi:hypothetical protein